MSSRDGISLNKPESLFINGFTIKNRSSVMKHFTLYKPKNIFGFACGDMFQKKLKGNPESKKIIILPAVGEICQGCVGP